MLVDNDPFVRPGLRMIVETMPRFKVVAEANSAEEALQQLERNLGVDLALIDIRMRGMNGIKLTERISKNFPAVSVLIFTNEDREEYLREAKEAGAKSYLLKERPWPEIASTIENIIDKGVDFPEPSSLAPPEPPLILEEHLTPRELQVLWHVGDGKSSKEIARLL
jgi:DNA-binding NarL/FixJ family response regulator